MFYGVYLLLSSTTLLTVNTALAQHKQHYTSNMCALHKFKLLHELYYVLYKSSDKKYVSVTNAIW
jgi:hypothetical protein